MGVAMMKTAYSPVFNEGFDFVCALFDREGRMIAQAEYNPSMLGAALAHPRPFLQSRSRPK
jgi:N-methylhydantoinase B/oxoprolinase/acetone carboxylase alpha subunit